MKKSTMTFTPNTKTLTIEDLETFLTENHLKSIGGYEYDSEYIGDLFVVAELDPAKDYNRTLLTKYSKALMATWVKHANEHLKCYPDDDSTDAFLETYPHGDI